MVTVALALLLWPLIRHGRRQGRSLGVFLLALGIAFALPLAAGGLYLVVGTPATLDGVPAAQPALDVDQAVAELRDHLKQVPDDLQGWLLLAQTEAALHQNTQARDAYDQALRLDPHNAAAMVGWAEADSIARHDHRIDGRALDLLKQAVQADPANQRGLWLLGISQFQHDDYADAAATWRRLQPLLEPGSTVAKAVTEQIAVAEARANGQPASVTPAETGPRLTVQVELAPALRHKVPPGAALFVYARANKGPAMPLAVARLDATQLPATVTLTDAMAMAPQLKLSSAKKVLVGARISASGQAVAQPGDLEGEAGDVPVDRTAPLRIVIDKVHP
jgi:cytochrome c-type biogenesis protein CcmH